jgi:hypothetical protein
LTSVGQIIAGIQQESAITTVELSYIRPDNKAGSLKKPFHR